MPLTAEVLLPLPLPPFSYLVPFGNPAGPVGGRVVVPWQGGLRIGICTRLAEGPLSAGLDLRELVGWLDEEAFLAAGAVTLLAELAEWTASPQGLILSAFAPTGLDSRLIHELSVPQPTLLAPDLQPGEWYPADTVDSELLEVLRTEGLSSERARVRPRLESRLVAAVTDLEALPEGARAAKQRQALATLLDGPVQSAAELARQAGVSASSVRSLITKGLARYEDVAASEPQLVLPEPGDALAAASLELPATGWFNLTGGLRRQRLAELLPLLKSELEQGLSPLLLAPEIRYLNEALAALRSEVPLLPFSGELDDAEREHVWRHAATGEPVVVAGTSAALLIRTPSPGSLIVLESASSSWKQLSGARLFIPEAARRLARLEDRRLIETEVTDNAELRASGLALLQLPPMEQRLHVSDLASASSWPLDADLSRVLRQVRERGRQAILLSSRRGFSGALSCANCSHSIGCPNCDLPLRYHQKENLLRCHQCNHSGPVPARCPECGAEELQPSRAAGTQWLASGVARLLPGFKVISYDADARQPPEDLLAGEPGVLVATTAALRLPPLPNVSLIAVTLFDAHLGLSDFRATENTLRLMLQLPELSSRPRPLVLVQTFQPEHPVLAALQAPSLPEALERFTDDTLERRQAFGYPPFALLARVEITARDEATAEREALRLRGALLASGAAESEILGPTPASVARVRGRFVWQLLLRCRQEDRFRELLVTIPANQQGARIRVDVDPRDVALQLD